MQTVLHVIYLMIVTGTDRRRPAPEFGRRWSRNRRWCRLHVRARHREFAGPSGPPRSWPRCSSFWHSAWASCPATAEYDRRLDRIPGTTSVGNGVLNGLGGAAAPPAGETPARTPHVRHQREDACRHADPCNASPNSCDNDDRAPATQPPATRQQACGLQGGVPTGQSGRTQITSPSKASPPL